MVIDNINFVLGSASPRRIYLLKEQGYNFKVLTAGSKEHNPQKGDPFLISANNALAKAKAILQNEKNLPVLCADTVVAVGTDLYGKPEDDADALRILNELNNKSHSVVTSFVIMKSSNTNNEEICLQVSVESLVTFGDFSDNEYMEYIKTGEPFGKAGAYAIQELGGRFVKEIKGSYTNIVGLPVYEVMKALNSIGVGYPWKYRKDTI